MNKKAIIGIILATFVIIVGLAWLAQPRAQVGGQSNPALASSLVSDTKLFDFGTISMANGNTSHEFQITNSSNQPVVLKKIYTSCMCTVADFQLNEKTYGPFGMEGMSLNKINVTINPGDTAIARVIYDPNAHGPAGVGAIDRLVYLEDENGSQLELEIKAVVTP